MKKWLAETQSALRQSLSGSPAELQQAGLASSSTSRPYSSTTRRTALFNAGTRHWIRRNAYTWL
jgi:hypothetical protein